MTSSKKNECEIAGQKVFYKSSENMEEVIRNEV